MTKRWAVVATMLALNVSALPVSGAAPGRGRFIVVLEDGADSDAVAKDHARRFETHTTFVYRHSLRGYAAAIPNARLDEVRADWRVLYVAEDSEMKSFAPKPPPPPTPQPPQFLSDAVDRIDGDLSSAVSGDGSGSVGINVAVFEGGVDFDHPDLNVVGGINCSSGRRFDVPDSHGTFVAGLIGARDNSFGVVGVAPGARIWSVRVFNKAIASRSTIICGIEFVTASRMDADPTNDIAVANLSLGGPGEDDGTCGRTRRDPLHQAICASVDAGVTYVVAAGNEGSDLQGTAPAAYDEVLTVTAIRDFDGIPGGLGFPSTPCQTQGDFVLNDDSRAGFSNYATLPADHAHTVAAPGFCVDSTLPGGGYGVGSGTSYATPLTAGTVALCIASGYCAGLNPAQIIQKIVADAAVYNITNPDYGFTGDPLLPVPDRYYGFLIRAALY